MLEPYVELCQRVGIELRGFEGAFSVLFGLRRGVCAAGREDAFVGWWGRLGGHAVGGTVGVLFVEDRETRLKGNVAD